MMCFLIFEKIKLSSAKGEIIYFAGGCFWCTEAVFCHIDGVISVTSGYANGKTKNPTYQAVCTGETGYAEAVKIEFNSEIIALNQLFEIFFTTHDPTLLNRQGGDIGTQYRSGVFCVNSQQKKCALSYIKTLEKRASIKTEIALLTTFYPAESYHQNYFNNNKNNPYCQMVIVPKLNRILKKNYE